MAVLAHLHDVDAEASELEGHPGEVLGLADASGVGAELVAVDVGDGDQTLVTAGGAGGSRLLAVEARRLEQVRIGVAQVRVEHPPAEQPAQGGPAVEGPVDHGSRSVGMRDRLRLSDRLTGAAP